VVAIRNDRWNTDSGDSEQESTERFGDGCLIR
jgi:hypothetical protein